MGIYQDEGDPANRNQFPLGHMPNLSRNIIGDTLVCRMAAANTGSNIHAGKFGTRHVGIQCRCLRTLRRTIRRNPQRVTAVRLYCRWFPDYRRASISYCLAIICAVTAIETQAKRAARPATKPEIKRPNISQQLPQDKRQNPAVPIIIDFDRRIDPQSHRHGALFSILCL